MKPQALKKGVTTSTGLLAEICHLHPNLKFCGEPTNAILSLPDDLLNYVLSLLKNDPVRPPRATMGQWRELLHILKSHWIIPLLYWQAGRLPDEFRPPAPVMDQMRGVFQWSRVRSLHMEKQLREITTAFETEGVRLLILKGPAYGKTVYPDLALRPGSDLDLLVLPEAYLKSRGIMERIGYKCEFNIFEGFKDFYCEENFSSPTNPKEMLPICFHWELHNFFGTKRGNIVQAFVKNASKVGTPNLNFWILNPVDALIHAALHLLTHHSEDLRLLWIYDIALLSQRLEVPEDWEMLQDRSVKLGGGWP